MSEVVTGILKLTFGFISDKVRTYGAEKLQDGSLTDQKFRRWIVREFDDIKFKLDSLSRKDLATSLSFLRQGVERLQISFRKSTESRNPSTSELPKNGKHSQDSVDAGANTSAQRKPAQKSVAVEDAIALANAIREMKIKSNEIFDLAKESFKKAAEKASEAFHNAALSTEERVLASEVRIASGILEHLERPEVAASDCLQYLRELHDMPAMQEIFSVQLQEGITSWIKSRFKKDSRAAILETVMVINLMLADFISKFTKTKMGIFDWPIIECSKQAVHPIYYEEECVAKMKKMRITTPWNIVMQNETGDKEFCPYGYAINSKGDIIGAYYDGGLQKLDKVTGTVQPFCLSASDDKTWGKSFIAIDDNDMVYVLSSKDDLLKIRHEPKLSVYSSDGKIIRHCPMHFIEQQPVGIAVTKDKNIVICGKNFVASDENAHVYVCDSSGKLIKSFPIRLESTHEAVLRLMVSRCDNSGDNEIILSTQSDPLQLDTKMDCILLYVCTAEGQLKRILKLSLRQVFLPMLSITFDHITKNFIVYAEDDLAEFTEQTYVECFSETGEKRSVLCLDYMESITGGGQPYHLVSHPNGIIAMVNANCVLYLQSSVM